MNQKFIPKHAQNYSSKTSSCPEPDLSHEGGHS